MGCPDALRSPWLVVVCVVVFMVLVAASGPLAGLAGASGDVEMATMWSVLPFLLLACALTAHMFMRWRMGKDHIGTMNEGKPICDACLCVPSQTDGCWCELVPRWCGWCSGGCGCCYDTEDKRLVNYRNTDNKECERCLVQNGMPLNVLAGIFCLPAGCFGSCCIGRERIADPAVTTAEVPPSSSKDSSRGSIPYAQTSIKLNRLRSLLSCEDTSLSKQLRDNIDLPGLVYHRIQVSNVYNLIMYGVFMWCLDAKYAHEESRRAAAKKILELYQTLCDGRQPDATLATAATACIKTHWSAILQYYRERLIEYHGHYAKIIGRNANDTSVNNIAGRPTSFDAHTYRQRQNKLSDALAWVDFAILLKCPDNNTVECLTAEPTCHRRNFIAKVPSVWEWAYAQHRYRDDATKEQILKQIINKYVAEIRPNNITNVVLNYVRDMLLQWKAIASDQIDCKAWLLEYSYSEADPDEISRLPQYADCHLLYAARLYESRNICFFGTKGVRRAYKGHTEMLVNAVQHTHNQRQRDAPPLKSVSPAAIKYIRKHYIDILAHYRAWLETCEKIFRLCNPGDCATKCERYAELRKCIAARLQHIIMNNPESASAADCAVYLNGDDIPTFDEYKQVFLQKHGNPIQRQLPHRALSAELVADDSSTDDGSRISGRRISGRQQQQ